MMECGDTMLSIFCEKTKTQFGVNDIKILIRKISSYFRSVTISYSKLSAFIFCPFKYKLIYVNDWKVPPTPYISLGQTVHKVLEEFHKRNLSAVDEIFSLYDELWVNLGFEDAAETVEFYESGRKMLVDYLSWEDSRKKEGIVTFAAEKEFEFKLGRHKVKGIIDRIDKYPDGAYEVIDYKTHRDEWTPERLENDLQLAIYSMGLKKSLGITPAKLSYLFLNQNKYVSVVKTSKHEDDAKRIVLGVAGKISREEFVPNTKSCWKCDFKQKCPNSVEKINVAPES